MARRRQKTRWKWNRCKMWIWMRLRMRMKMNHQKTTWESHSIYLSSPILHSPFSIHLTSIHSFILYVLWEEWCACRMYLYKVYLQSPNLRRRVTCITIKKSLPFSAKHFCPYELVATRHTHIQHMPHRTAPSYSFSSLSYMYSALCILLDSRILGF